MAAADLELDPWNTDFAWTDRTGPYRRLASDQVVAFDRDGFIVLPDVFAADDLALLIEALDRHEKATDAFLRTSADERIAIAESGAITFTVHLVEREPAACNFCGPPALRNRRASRTRSRAGRRVASER